MSWWEFVPQVLLAVAVISVPGMILALACRLSVFSAFLFAPLLSVASLSLGAIALELLHVPWNLASFGAFHLGIVVAAAALAAVVRRLGWWESGAEGRLRGRGRASIAGLTGALIGAFLICSQLFTVFGEPTSISQSYDNIFHLNAVRYIADTGEASSLTLNTLATGLPGINFYPAAWHDAAALVFSVFPSSLPSAMNALTVAVAAVAWPLSVVALATKLWPGRPLLLLSAGALSSSFIAFPGLMLKWGVLYPNMLGYALLPAFLALVIGWTRAVAAGAARQIVPRTLLVMTGAVALVLSHPNALTGAAALALPFFAAPGWRIVRDHGRARALRASIIGVALLACVGVWAVVRPPASASTWPDKLPSGQAVGEFVAQSFDGNSAAWVISFLTLLGAYRCLQTRGQRWLVATWALTGLLWVTAASMQPGTLRTLLTGPWYNDSFRLAALTALPSLLLAAAGIGEVLRMLSGSRLRAAFAALPRRVAPVLEVAVIAALAVAVTALPGMRAATDAVAREFRETPDSLVLTTDEMNVLEHVDEFVAEDEVIAVNPWDGSALVYALEQRKVTQFHTLGATLAQYSDIPLALNRAATDPAVCRQVEEGRVKWYLHFDDTLDIGGWAKPSFEGFDGVIESGVVRAVYTSGDVGLYEIVGCEE